LQNTRAEGVEVHSGEDTLRANDPWRADLLRKCGQGMLLLGTPWVLYLLAQGARPVAFVLYPTFLLGGAVAAFGTAASFRWRATLLVLNLLVCGGIALRYGGFGPGTALCLALGPVIAALLLSGRVAMLSLLASAVAVWVLGAQGRLETTPRWVQALLQPETWLRMAVTFTLLTALMMLLVRGALRRLEASLRETRRALLESVSERGAREAAEQRWRRISEASFEGVAFSERGIVVDASEQMARMFGYGHEELIGKPVVELVSLEHRSLVQAIIASGQTTTYSHHAMRKDGSVFPVETRARLLPMGDRTLRVTVLRDLSEVERLQGELKKRERLAAVGELVAGVAHEVRTPLFSISATLDAYEPYLDAPAERREFTDLLRSQIDRLSTLMRDLLDYGSPPTPRLARGSVVQPIRRAISACAGLAQAAGVVLEAGPLEGIEIERDAERLEQVFVNLISNAVHHAPRGTTVRASAVASEERQGVSCSVDDEGGGVPAEDLGRLFQPFFSRRKGGTGLGLAIVQRIVEQHGGVVRAANRAGGGASFTVFLPAAPGSA
jgi:PAS domain S-box-containing protein